MLIRFLYAPGVCKCSRHNAQSPRSISVFAVLAARLVITIAISRSRTCSKISPPRVPFLPNNSRYAHARSGLDVPDAHQPASFVSH